MGECIEDIKLSYGQLLRINDFAAIFIRWYFKIVYPEARSRVFRLMFDLLPRRQREPYGSSTNQRRY